MPKGTVSPEKARARALRKLENAAAGMFEQGAEKVAIRVMMKDGSEANRMIVATEGWQFTKTAPRR